MKSRLVLTKSQQNGILLFAGILIIIIFSRFYYRSQVKGLTSVEFGVDSVTQQKIDSLKALKLKEVNTPYIQKIYPFNPNFLKAGKAYRLGITADEYDRLKGYRQSGEWINSVEDFKKVTEISEERLAKIAPYFKFPDWVVAQQKESENQKSEALSVTDKFDINKATGDELMKINGIGEKLSARILNYRNKIGGFRSVIQLKDVYGLKYELIEQISNRFKVIEADKTNPLDINTASLIQLAEVPYFDYELAREIYQYIKVNEGISSFEELSKLQQFPTSKIDRIKLYLTIIE
jgi:competence ComEA-like helix-hairpin-helix protein